MFPSEEKFEFIPPPEAPVFEPDEEEWKDPLAYIAKIHPYAVKVGICKIRPPPDWHPPFSIDCDNFKFTPRIQKLNELEANTRVKLNFIDAIAKFWDLQGSQIKLPNVEKKPLDIHSLHKIVQEEGGFEDVTRLRRWSRVAFLMGYTAPASSGILRRHYEKILYPYDVFMSGAMTGGEPEVSATKQTMSRQEMKELEEDPEFEPMFGDETPPSNVGTTRKSRNNQDVTDETPFEVDYTKNPELKKLQFASPGPKITGRRNKKMSARYNPKDYIKESEPKPISNKRRSPKKKENIFDLVRTFIDDYKCKVCDNGDDEDCMLLCDSCDASYHTFCLIPPLPSIPPGDWRCPNCVAKECKKSIDSYGFEQGKKVYTLEDFGEMADKWKEEYFAMPPTEVPTRVVENEFWKLVSSIDNDVAVEYAADLHTADHGSGFPTRKNTSDPDLDDYVMSPWNLNNFPNNERSVLKYITQDISGMKVPWIYVGMCFSSFCWHTEDHWSYSINFHHWGEPKTWYGVPQSEAERLESCVKQIAPELFEKNPDLFHHLTTLCSPTTLMNHGVPVFRTNQYPGEFVITFPRAYHAGFNTGYNCAEAVNFCPADWLQLGQSCIQHYQNLRRATVFSHDELVCKMASIPDALDLDLAKKLYGSMQGIVATEIEDRTKVHQKGIIDRQREAFELIIDEDRQCGYCKTTIFFSAIVCSCNKKKLSCLNHAKELCSCPDYKKYIRYRYTLEELPDMLANLKKRADSFDNWEKEVQKALSSPIEQKIELLALKEFITEAEDSQFPECELLEQLRVYVNEADQCAQVASQLLTKKHKTRKTSTTNLPAVPRLTLNELRDFVNQVNNLPCIIKEATAIDKLMAQVESFRYDAKIALNSDDYKEKKVMELLEHAETMDIDLPEINDLRLDLKASKWLESIEEILNQEEPISLDVIRSCVDQGIGLRKKQASEKPLSRLKELLYAADRWEEKAKLCLQAKPRHMMGTLEVIVQEASKVKIILPNVSALKEALLKGKEWSCKVEKVQNDDYYPYYDILEALVVRGRPIPVRLEQLPQMESQVAAARAWKDRTSRTFVKKGSNKQLMELLRPRRDIGKFERKPKKKKHVEKSDKSTQDKHNNKKSDSKTDSKSHKGSKSKENGKTKVKEELLSSPKNHKSLLLDSEKSATSNDDEKKPIGLAVEAINVDEYQAPDPLTVAQALKQDETAELAAMKELREKNRQKLIEQNLDGPYCLCRKGIDGFMVRCNLCLDWYHSTCICAPKTVHGKPIGKGYSAWSATREVRYCCTLCSRSRRPRLDNILQLLMSLQKLPVRVPEGEALQFLTERAMNWQDRAKQALADPEIHRIITEAKVQAEKVLAEKQAAVSASNSHNGTQLNIIFYQKLLSVKKIQIERTSKTETLETDKVSENPLEINEDVVSMDTSENIVKLMSPATMLDVPKPPQEVIALVTTPVKSSFRPNAEPSTTPSGKQGTEGGMDADLECTEKMGGSPVSVKPSNPMSDPKVVRIQSASSSRAQSPIDVCTPLEQLASKSSIKSPSDKSNTSSLIPDALIMEELSTVFLDQLEELMFEGELLEVGLDEVQQIWAVLQIQRPLPKDICNIMNSEYRRKLIKERKRQRKRKLEEAKAAQNAQLAAQTAAKMATAAAVATAKAAKLSASLQTTAKKIKQEEVDVKQEEEMTADDKKEADDSQDEDDCSAKPCKKPLGDEVEWVQCDNCESWYHCMCVGISAQDASKIDEYTCPYCGTPAPATPMEVDTEPVVVTPSDGPNIPDLSVIAELAHQIITDQEKANASVVSTTAAIDVASTSDQTLPVVKEVVAAPTLDLNSLICLADVSEKMDVTPIAETPAENKITNIVASDNKITNTENDKVNSKKVETAIPDIKLSTPGTESTVLPENVNEKT